MKYATKRRLVRGYARIRRAARTATIPSWVGPVVVIVISLLAYAIWGLPGFVFIGIVALILGLFRAMWRAPRQGTKLVLAGLILLTILGAHLYWSDMKAAALRLQAALTKEPGLITAPPPVPPVSIRVAPSSPPPSPLVVCCATAPPPVLVVVPDPSPMPPLTPEEVWAQINAHLQNGTYHPNGSPK